VEARGYLDDILNVVEQSLALEDTHVQFPIVHAGSGAESHQASIELDVASDDQRSVDFPDLPIQDQSDLRALVLADDVQRRAHKGPRSERLLLVRGDARCHCRIQADARPHQEVTVVGLAHIDGAGVPFHQHPCRVEQDRSVGLDRQRVIYTLFQVDRQLGQTGAQTQRIQGGDSHLQGPYVGRPNRKHAQGGIRVHQTAGDLVQRAIATGGDHHVCAPCGGPAGQFRGLQWCLGLVDGGLPPVAFQVLDYGIQFPPNHVASCVRIVDQFCSHLFPLVY